MEDPLKLGLYVLLLLPGFIFVQVREYHLLREKRSQFEKSLDIILWSAAIWMVACTVPVWWPWSASRTLALDEAKRALQNASSPSWFSIFTADAAMFFGTGAGWSFVVANAWGIVRKAKGIDAFVHFITGRDWYPSVALKFLSRISRGLLSSRRQVIAIWVSCTADPTAERTLISFSARPPPFQNEANRPDRRRRCRWSIQCSSGSMI